MYFDKSPKLLIQVEDGRRKVGIILRCLTKVTWIMQRAAASLRAWRRLRTYLGADTDKLWKTRNHENAGVIFAYILMS